MPESQNHSPWLNVPGPTSSSRSGLGEYKTLLYELIFRCPRNRATTCLVIRTSGFAISYCRDLAPTMSQRGGTCPHPGCSCLVCRALSQAKLDSGMSDKPRNYVAEGSTKSLPQWAGGGSFNGKRRRADSNRRIGVLQTPALTSWLHRRQGQVYWSGRRDSNPRPLPWQGSILPLNYFRS